MLLVTAAGGTVAAWALQKRFPELDLSLPYTVSLALFTATFAATIAMATYSWVTQKNQRREWRHEMEIRHFEEIYGPLYEESLKVLDELNRYESPWLQKWPEVKKKSFGPFVDPGIAKDLDRLEQRLEKLGKLRSATYDIPLQIIDRVSTGPPWGENLSKWVANLKDRFREGQGFRNFFYAPGVNQPAPHIIDSIRKVFSDAGLDESALLRYIGQVKAAFLQDPTMKERVDLTDAIRIEARSVLERIRDRMKHPFG